MAFTPNTRVYLLSTPLDNTYKNQILFASLSSQYDYFTDMIKHSFENVTYQRKDNVIRVSSHIDNLWDSNYVMYQNANFNSKWFYAFITKMEYVSERATDIFIETDVYQTWLFECELKESFVVREHVTDDTIGKHLVDEQLEIGEYKMATYTPSGELGDSWNILAVSDNSPLGNNELIGNIYGNVVTGLTYFPFPNTTLGIQWLKNTIDLYKAKPDAIVMIFTVPEVVVPSVANENSGWQLGYPLTSYEPRGYKEFTDAKQISNVDGYVPKNKKLFTYPYKCLYISNNSGQSAVMRYEDFPENDMEFTLMGTVTPNPQVILVPNNYKGYGLKYEYGLTLSGFPMCSWVTDAYLAWLAQNGASTAVALVGSAVAVGAGIFTANPLVVGGGMLSIANQLAQIHQASLQPDQAKGQTGSGSLMFGCEILDFYFAHMTIKYEFAKRIDNFFTMFGYKVNTLKVPETHSRQNWNYIQTIDVNIEGAIPTEDMRRLKKVYDDGVTLWHTTTGFLDYSHSNNII